MLKNHHEAWWEPYKKSIPKNLADYLAVEDTASSLRFFNSALLPGVLQTEAYARAVMEGAAPFNLAQSVIEQRVKLRMQRQWHLFERPNPPKLHVILEESVLYRLIGGPQVQYEQLMHLIEVADYPFLTLQVLPLSVAAAWATHTCPLFILLDFPNEQPTLLSTEDAFRGNENTINPREVQYYETAFGKLIEYSPSHEDSVKYIADVAKLIRKRPNKAFLWQHRE